MIKKSLIVASLLLVSTSAIAVDTSKLYVGVGVTSGSGTLTATGNSTATLDYDSSSTPIKIGYMLKNDNRFEFSLESMDHKYSAGTDTVSGWNMDWNFVYPNNKLADVVTPFLTVGFGSYTYEDSGELFDDGEDLNGFAFNYGFGGLYSINKNIELETSFKGKIINWEDIQAGSTTITSDSTGTALYVGVNYKF